MTGGGFGGSTVNLVDKEAVLDFQRSIVSAYEKATGLTPQIIVSAAAEGARDVEA
jgi:galactokinase